MGPAKTAPRSLPGVLVHFLDRATVGLAATRDADLVPRIHWLSGWRLDADGRSLWALFAREFADGLPQAKDGNGRLAVTLEQIGTHECYQFKGRILDLRPSTAEEQATADLCRERFVVAVSSFVKALAGQHEILRRYFLKPAVAVKLGVQDVFLQTPGPGAGSLLARLEDPA